MGFTARLVLFLALLATPLAASADNYSDIWWNPSESGWGVTIADHETNLFVIMYTYGSDGKPTWFAVSGGTFNTARTRFDGDVYATRGPAYTSATFDPALVTRTKVGTLAITWSSSNAALLAYTINGISQTKSIQRFAFGSSPEAWGTDASDIWWNSAESGWGLSIAQHGDNLFAIWYTYDASGAATWLFIPSGTFSGATAFIGDMYQTTGPYFGGATFDPSRVVTTPVGSGSLVFGGPVRKSSDACPGLTGSFIATVGGQAYPRLICKYPFGNYGPGTASPPPVVVHTDCVGGYQATTTFPTSCSSGGKRTFVGEFSVSGITWTQTTPLAPTQAGMLTVKNFFADVNIDYAYGGVVSCSDEFHSEDDYPMLVTLAPVPSNPGNYHGTSDIDIGIGTFHLDFQVIGNTTVRGTMNYMYSEGTTYTGSGTFQCLAP